MWVVWWLHGRSYGDLLQEDLHHTPCLPDLLQIEPLSPRQATASTGDAQTLKGRSGSVSVGSLGPGAHKPLFVPSECIWRVWSLILNEIFLPLLLWAFSFALGHGVSFSGGIQHSPIDGCSAGNHNFGVLTGENEHMSFYFMFLAVTLLRHIFILPGLAFKVCWEYPNKCLAYG